MHDQLVTGRRFRSLNVVDDVTKECLGAIPDTSISGRRVARELDALIARRGKPGRIVSDNGTEFTSTAVLAWAERTGVAWHYIGTLRAADGCAPQPVASTAQVRNINERTLVTAG